MQEHLMETYERSGSGLPQVLDVLRRRKWLAILTFLAVLGAGVTVVRYLPEVYRSKATVLIERQQIPDELVRPTVTSTLEVRLHTISQEILSRSRLELLVNQFNLYPELKGEKPLEVIIDEMRKDIGLELVGSEQRRGDTATVAFNITYSGKNPQQVAMVTNTLASFYIEENLKVREQQAVGTADFLRVQLDEMQKNLVAQEEKLGEFKEKYIGELPDQQEANLATLEQLSTRLRLNNDNQVRVSETRSALVTQLSEAQGLAGGGPDAGATKLAQMKLQLADLERRYTDKYPDVVRLKQEIASLEAQLLAEEHSTEAQDESETVELASPYVMQIKSSIKATDVELSTLKAEAQHLQNTIATYQQRVDNAPRREQEYQVLSRDYETSKELYRSLLLRQKEAELAENMETRQKGELFRILDPAAVSETPAAPDRPKLYLMVLMAALGLSAGLVLLAEQLNTSFHSVDAVRAMTPIPVLVSIPEIVTRGDRNRQRFRFALGTVGAVLGLAAIIGASYLLVTTNSQFAALLLR
jgi:polysaccharide chain length determinant protein (PEP-CTERM system associated)